MTKLIERQIFMKVCSEIKLCKMNQFLKNFQKVGKPSTSEIY